MRLWNHPYYRPPFFKSRFGRGTGDVDIRVSAVKIVEPNEISRSSSREGGHRNVHDQIGETASTIALLQSAQPSIIRCGLDAQVPVQPRNSVRRLIKMLRWAVIFLVVALVAALFGFTGIASAAAGIAKFLFFLFLVMCLIFFIIGISVGKKVL